MAALFTLYRLIILCLLDSSSLPLTGTKITGFMLEKDYTDYFTVQNSLSQLQESNLIETESIHGNTLFRITEEGRQTLDFYRYKISAGIRNDISEFLRENECKIKTEVSVRTDCRRTPQGDYIVRCIRSDRDRTLIDLSISVTSKETAESVCRNWSSESDTIFALIADELIR